MINREQITVAMFAAVSAIAGLKTASRQVRTIDDTPPPDQPALFLEQGVQAATAVRGQPTKWTLHYRLVLYVHQATCGQPDVMSAVNQLLDAIDAVVSPRPNGDEQTFGQASVQMARIIGDIQLFEGRLGQQAGALIPVQITAL